MNKLERKERREKNKLKVEKIHEINKEKDKAIYEIYKEYSNKMKTTTVLNGEVVEISMFSHEQVDNYKMNGGYIHWENGDKIMFYRAGDKIRPERFVSSIQDELAALIRLQIERDGKIYSIVKDSLSRIESLA
jgi:hypothetical protein